MGVQRRDKGSALFHIIFFTVVVAGWKISFPSAEFKALWMFCFEAMTLRKHAHVIYRSCKN